MFLNNHKWNEKLCIILNGEKNECYVIPILIKDALNRKIGKNKPEMLEVDICRQQNNEWC